METGGRLPIGDISEAAIGGRLAEDDGVEILIRDRRQYYKEIVVSTPTSD